MLKFQTELGPEQLTAVDMIISWYRSHPTKPFHLAGLAGTGKTTILKYIDDCVIFPRTAYAAYTGKAASVLRSKDVNATTIHGLMYRSQKTGEITNPRTGKIEDIFEHTKRHTLDYDCIIIDEASMVTADIKTDLESYGVPVLYVGDHGQLPPVNSDPAVDLDNLADYKLETIHRQALDSPIISAAMQARQGMTIPYQITKHLKVIKKEEFHDRHVTAMLPDDGVMLCWKNSTRSEANQYIRKLINGHDGVITNDDRIICLRNIHRKGLFNGLTGICTYADEITIGIQPDGSSTIIEYDAWYAQIYLQFFRFEGW